MSSNISIKTILENHELRIRELKSIMEGVTETMDNVVTKFNTLINSDVIEKVNKLIDTTNELEKKQETVENTIEEIQNDDKGDIIMENTTQIGELCDEISKVRKEIGTLKTQIKSSNTLVRTLKEKVESQETTNTEE